MEKNKKFAQGLCFFKYFWLFVIGCMFGTFYEELLHLFTYGNYSRRAGMLYGPFNPVYGLGLVLMVLFLNKQHDWKKLLIYGAVLGGGFEYILNFLQELFIHSSSWNYDNHFLNINGRTTIPFALFWGVLCVLCVKFVYPFLSKWIEKIPYKFGNIASIIIVVALSIDMLLTGVVLLRQGLRHDNVQPYTIIGEWIDDVYNDEYLNKLFPNMQKCEEEKSTNTSSSSIKTKYTFQYDNKYIISINLTDSFFENDNPSFFYKKSIA